MAHIAGEVGEACHTTDDGSGVGQVVEGVAAAAARRGPAGAAPRAGPAVASPLCVADPLHHLGVVLAGAGPVTVGLTVVVRREAVPGGDAATAVPSVPDEEVVGGADSPPGERVAVGVADVGGDVSPWEDVGGGGAGAEEPSAAGSSSSVASVEEPAGGAAAGAP